MTNHLARPHAIYRFRRRIPASIGQILQRTHFDVSLKITDSVRARRLVRRLTVAIDQLDERLQTMPKSDLPTPGQLNLVLKAIFNRVLNEGEEERRSQPPGPSDYDRMTDPAEDVIEYHDLSPEDRAAFDAIIPEPPPDGEPDYPPQRARWWDGWVTLNDFSEAEPYLDRALDEFRLLIPKDDPSYKRDLRDATKVIARATVIEAERWQGTYDNDHVPPPWIDADYPIATDLVRPWFGQFKRDEVKFLARSIDDVADKYARRFLRHTRAQKTGRDWEMAARYFVSLIANIRMGDITDAQSTNLGTSSSTVPPNTAREFTAALPQGPRSPNATRSVARSTRAKSDGGEFVKFEGRTWSLAEAERKIATITRKTANKHLSFFTKLWKSRIVPRPLRPINPFAGSLYPKREVRNDASPGRRTNYGQDELVTLFTSPIWTGCESFRQRTTPGPLIVPDARFWTPLIAVFTGMRREEVCQLKASDFDRQEGIWFVRLQRTEGRRLKTVSAQRDIPIHHELIKIGLKEFVAYRAGRFLFPELTPSPTDRARGDVLGKWFRYYRHAIGIARDEVDFHAFRTTFIQHLRRAGEPLDKIKPISGHQENDVTLYHYAPAFSLQQKLEVIEKFELPVEFPQLYGRMPELLKVLAEADAVSRRRKKRRAARRSPDNASGPQ